MTKAALAAALALAAAMLPARAEHVRPARWCMQMNVRPHTLDCNFATRAQCEATASGNIGWCMENPAANPARHRKR